ncbi:hypothetical protein LOAG_08958 [Loa loa]|uniref:Uncharacterized protein n=1 Tax=Loa loa TaxID=7209 RepID=A0A1S0TSS9_LOALO|nr:hypothetical protein LOAG_08958 [Loa loa]EFO19534.1 hypothetical protein LOAG_08958 [Loa loa]
MNIFKSIKESPGSWLFKSPKRRKKEWLQRQLNLRRKMRTQTFSSKRPQLIRHRDNAPNRLLTSPKRLEASLSTSQMDGISTAHARNQTRSSSERIAKSRRSHQTAKTARSIVEEDLTKRLQQMDYKLTPTKTAKTRSERSGRSITTSSGRSSNSKTLNSSSSGTSVRSSRRRHVEFVETSKSPSSQSQRTRHQKFNKRSFANKPKYSNKSNHQLLQRHQKMDEDSKYHSQSQSVNHNITDSTVTARSISRQSKGKLSSESEKGILESEVNEGISARSLKDKRVISNRRKRRKKQLTKVDDLRKMKSKEEGNLKKALNHRLKLEKKFENEKEEFIKRKKKKKEKKTKEQLGKHKKRTIKHLSNTSTDDKVKRSSIERSNEKLTKTLPLSFSKSKKLRKNHHDDRDFSQEMIKTAKLAKRLTRNDIKKSTKEAKNKISKKFNRNSNVIIYSDKEEKSDRKISASSKSNSGRNGINTKSKIRSNRANNASAKTIIPKDTSLNHLSQIPERKLDSSSLSSKSKTSETKKASMNQKFRNKPKKGNVKKLKRKNGKN